ncbi:MAG: HaeIII family restriction endonuclease [Clostridiaceae bacterium]|jgi:hypothetical protein|nr:HaeIII family restriction endonuclease [Clostridiaceae bacterium]
MAIQTKLGKAFEFACLQSLYNHLLDRQTIIIDQTKALNTAKKSFDSANESIQKDMIKGADAATRIVLKLEPQLEHPLGNNPLFLSIQEDSAGISGDVRDIVCLKRQNQWEIGISCKHNHAAVKHSRLSPHIDFGNSWFGIPCSKEYFNDINPLFDELTKLKNDGVLWRNIDNKEQRFYIPILQAFMKELNRLNTANSGIIPSRLLCYVLGKNDFYKVITYDRRKATQVQCFNLYATLNKSSGVSRPLVNVPKLTMPTRFYDIGFKPGSGNTILVACDNGWTVSMRIHSARSLVEPSLKFDIGLIGVPPTLYTQFEPWN